MARRQLTTLRAALMTADWISAVALFAVVAFLRYGPAWQAVWYEQTETPVWLAAVAYAAIWVVGAWMVGLYRVRARWTTVGDMSDVVRAGAIVLLGVVTTLYVFKLSDVGRLFLVGLLASQMLLTFASRVAIRRLYGALRELGFGVRHMLVVGTGPAAQAFADLVERHRDLGIRVIGHLSSPSERPSVVSRPILGRLDEIERVFHECVVDEVALCLPAVEWPMIEPVTVLCREEGKSVRIPLGDIGLSWSGGRVEEFDGLPILSHVRVPDTFIGPVLKRLVDIVGAAVALVVLSPVFVVTIIAMKLTDPGPVLFRQVRVGLHGRLFTIYKFRTMVPDAEERYAEVAALSDTRGPAFKMTNDPRITRTGRILRRTSIDELPQLLNVIRGEMSLVGPRPAPPREVAGYDVWHRRRLSMKPGITGLWQVEARRDEDFDRRAMLDLSYIDQWSFWLDLKIMLRTIPAMLAGR